MIPEGIDRHSVLVDQRGIVEGMSGPMQNYQISGGIQINTGVIFWPLGKIQDGLRLKAAVRMNVRDFMNNNVPGALHHQQCKQRYDPPKSENDSNHGIKIWTISNGFE